MANRTGQQLGHYRLVRLLGRGGFAEVYLGEHLRLGTQAAIKVLYAALEENDVEGFLREAQTVAKLKHPHIVRVFDFDIEEHTPFLVMDYLPNGNVRRSYPKGVSLPLEAIVSYVKQVASALQYAHDQKLIHRDIKPENMLLDQDNSIVLSDFGIALMAQSSRYQSTQEVAGTAAYMAPEQFQGHPHRASDQYALGVVVYEWLSGDRPFHGTFSEIASQHLFVPPPFLHGRVPVISPDIEQVVLRALEKDPHKRFASVQTFATAFEQACIPTLPPEETEPKSLPDKQMPPDQLSRLRGDRGQLPQRSVEQTPHTIQDERVSSHPTPPSVTPMGRVEQLPLQTPIMIQQSQPRETKPVQTPPDLEYEILEPHSVLTSKRGISRRKVLVGLGLTGLVITGLIIGGGAVMQWINPSHPLYTYLGHSGVVYSVAWSPDGKHIASASLDSTVQVWDAANGGNVLIYRGHSGSVDSVAWSPDGKRIVSGGDDKTVQVWDAANGNNVFTYRGNFQGAIAVAWSPDGKRIASGGRDTTVQVWDAANGNNVFTYRGHSSPVDAISWSPDGNWITSSSWYDKVQVWDAVDGNQRFSFLGGGGIAWSPDSKRIVSGGDGVQVWDAVDGSNVFTYHGQQGVDTVAWSPDGKRIASGSIDHTVQVRDAATGGNTFTYHGHSDTVTAVTWSPDSKRIASGGGAVDTTVQVWEAV